MNTADSTGASSDENPYAKGEQRRRERNAEPATHLWCAHAAKLIEATPNVPRDHLAALASMTDHVVTTKTLIARKLLTAGQVPTVEGAAKFRGLDPSMVAKNKIAGSGYVALALDHGLPPLLEQYALSTVLEAAESGHQWAANAIANARDAVTVQLSGGGRYRSKAVKFTASALVRDFKAPVDAVKALSTATTATDAATVRIVSKWEAEDWKAARNGDTAAELPQVWAAGSMKPSAALEWLARGQVPAAAVTLLVGDEGIGKSLFWVWLITYVTTGKPCAEYGIPSREPQHVFLALTEDDWATAVRPRLEVSGADFDHVHIVCVEPDGSGAPTFPNHLEVLYDAEVTPAMVIVDAWLDTVPAGLQVRDPQQARQALHPWTEFAATTRASVMLLTHTNRAPTANARDKYGITSELRKKARSTLFAQADPDNPDCVLIGPEKSNIAGQVEATRFRIVSVPHFPPSDDSDGTVPKLEYVEPVGKTSRDLIGEAFHGRDDDTDSAEATEAEQWLEDYLTEHGQTLSKDVKAAGKADGIGERSLARAAKKLNGKNRLDYVSVGFPRKTHWRLLGGIPVGADGQLAEPSSRDPGMDTAGKPDVEAGS